MVAINCKVFMVPISLHSHQLSQPMLPLLTTTAKTEQASIKGDIDKRGPSGPVRIQHAPTLAGWPWSQDSQLPGRLQIGQLSTAPFKSSAVARETLQGGSTVYQCTRNNCKRLTQRGFTGLSKEESWCLDRRAITLQGQPSPWVLIWHQPWL